MDVQCLRRHRFLSPDNVYTYHISVIDYLQQWNLNKKGERFAKTKFLGKKGDELSACEPNYYQQRYIKVLTNQIITIDKSEKPGALQSGSLTDDQQFESNIEKILDRKQAAAKTRLNTNYI
jgi:hypothetical protein